MQSALCPGLALAVWAVSAVARAAAPALGDANSFAILGGSTVASSGATRVVGNVGVSPGRTITGFAGELHRDDALARAAQRDARDAFDALSSGSCTPAPLTGALPPGVYCATSPLQGTLTLDGDAAAVWIFRVDGALQTAAGSSIALQNGAAAAHVFWQVTGSATLAPRTQFVGNLLVAGDLTLESGASLYGRALSRGSVTLDANLVTLCCNPIALSSVSAEGIINASGGTAPYVFSASTLPPGWTLSAQGTVTRTSAPGPFTFSVTATDANGCTGSRDYQGIVVPTIPTLSVPLLAMLASLLAAAALRRLS
jgi:hypothetical protein